jgi:S-adenosylmethionine:tRNA ribosyltransferase-isomerase
MIIAATAPARHGTGKLLMVDTAGGISHHRAEDLAALLRPGDLLVANDAATFPASLAGFHERTGDVIEVRLAGRASLRGDDVRRFTAIVFGAGDYHTRTEDRALPPRLRPGDRLVLGPLRASVTGFLGHPRLIDLTFDGDIPRIWAGIAAHGHPIQYAHLPQSLALWDVWTPIAAHPAAFEPPSAGFALSWSLLARLQQRGVSFATLTHAAGISSTGDPLIEARLPLDEPYHLPPDTVSQIRRAGKAGGRIIAVGTTVVRALEHAAFATGTVRSGHGLATQRIGPETSLRVMDGILTGIHEPHSTHYQLLRAFAADEVLEAATRALEEAQYRCHEFGDSMLVMREGTAHRSPRSTVPRHSPNPILAAPSRSA